MGTVKGTIIAAGTEQSGMQVMLDHLLQQLKQTIEPQATTGLSRRMVQIGQQRFELMAEVLDCGGSSGGNNDDGATSSMWWMTALAVSPDGLPDLAVFFCPLPLEVYSKC